MFRKKQPEPQPENKNDVRQRVADKMMAGASMHRNVARMIEHQQKQTPTAWAAVVMLRLRQFFKVSESDGLALISEMSGDPNNGRHWDWNEID